MNTVNFILLRAHWGRGFELGIDVNRSRSTLYRGDRCRSCLSGELGIDCYTLLWFQGTMVELGIDVNTRFGLGLEVGINMRFGNILRAGYTL